MVECEIYQCIIWWNIQTPYYIFVLKLLPIKTLLLLHIGRYVKC